MVAESSLMVGCAPHHGVYRMTTATNPKIVYARAQDCHKSPDNVRTQSDPVADAELAANIGETGIVLENLIGVAIPRKKGHFEIYGGGRRLEATLANIASGKLPDDFMVAVLVARNKDEAIEMSQAENYFQLPMNPADECMGFKRIIEKSGKTPAQLAIRFGKTERFILGRLRLADLAEPVFAALRQGAIGIEVAQAYASTGDIGRQATIFAQLDGSYYRNNTAEIRRQLAAFSYSGSDPKALLVGRDPYLAAGGNIDEDLFSDAATERWTDTELLDRLAEERLAAAADEIRSREGFAEVRPLVATHVPYMATTGLRRIHGVVPDLSAEQEARKQAIEAEIEAIEEAASDEHDYSDEQLEQIEALEAELGGIVDREPVYDAGQKAQALAFVVIGEDGTPVVEEALFLADTGEDEDGERLDSDVDDGESDDDEKPRSVKPAFSQKLVERLAVMRTELVALHVANDPHFAMDLGSFIMVDAALRRTVAFDLASDLRAPRPDNAATRLARDTVAAESWAKLEADLDRSWVDAGSVTARFDAFRALDEEVRADWFAWAIARTIQPIANSGSGASFLRHVGRALDIDVARWWRPTARNFFDAVSRPWILDLFEEIGGAELKSRYGASKKADLAAAAEKLFSGNVLVEPEIKEQALAWLPAPMSLEDPVVVRANLAELAAAIGRRDDADPDAEPIEPANDAEDVELAEAA